MTVQTLVNTNKYADNRNAGGSGYLKTLQKGVTRPTKRMAEVGVGIGGVMEEGGWVGVLGLVGCGRQASWRSHWGMIGYVWRWGWKKELLRTQNLTNGC